MRLRNVTKNVIITLLSEIIRFILGIIVPRLIILKFGSTINGFTVTVNNILNVINLIQAGAVGASIYEMYAPVSKQDYQSISNILYSSQRYFRKLGLIFIILVIASSPLISIRQLNNGLSLSEMEWSIIILGINGLFSFWFFAYYDILFCSHQKKYIISLATIGYYIVYYALIFFTLAMPHAHFTWLYIASIGGNLTKLVILYIMYKKQYDYLLPKPDHKFRYPIKNRYHLLVQQISINGIEASVPIMLSYVKQYSLVSVYAIYNMIYGICSMIIFLILNSVVNVMGNVVRTEQDDKIIQIYDLIHLIFSVLGTWIGACMMCLLLPFVCLYTQGITDINYIRSDFALIMIVYFFSISIYVPIYLLANVYGYYEKITVYHLVGLIVALSAALLGGRYFEQLIVLMPAVLYIIISIGIYGICRRNVKWLKNIGIWKRDVVMVLFLIIAYIASKQSFYQCNTWTE